MYKKKILILGVGGLLGHRVFINLSKNKKFNVIGTLRKIRKKNFFKKKQIIENFNVLNLNNLNKKINSIRPDVIINCIGITNKKIKSTKIGDLILINSVLPHYLDNLSSNLKFKLIHISTDCVFSGSKNFYTETDPCDVQDLYGITKFIGEIKNSKNLTIRTSIIGHEVNEKNGLLEWFLSKKRVKGFAKVIYSGVTTNHLSEIIEKCITKYNLSGLFQVSSKPISKFELLKLIKKIYKKKIKIQKSVKIKKKLILKSKKFTKKTKYLVKPWKDQIEEMRFQNNEKY